MLRCRSALSLLALSASMSAQVFAQAAAPPDTETPAATLKLNVRTVLVDVVVTDKNSQAVSGLNKEDFQVFEDGKPQTISFFEPSFAAAPSATPPPPLPPNTFTNVPTVMPSNSVNVLLMDAMNTPMTDQAYVHKEMVRYLASIPPGIRIGIFLLGEKLQIIQGFTQDSAVLRASINRLAANPTSSPLLPTIQGTGAQDAAVNAIQTAAIAQGYGGTPDPTLEATAAAFQQFVDQEAGFESNQRTRMTLEALQQIARYLAGVPGRKNLIWFLGSFPACLPAITSENELTNGGCPYDELDQKTMAMLADARISVYPIDATGLGTHVLFSAENPKVSGAPTNFQTMIADQKTSLDAENQANALNMTQMDQLAKNTGGKARYNGNDLKGALAADIENGSRYYTIAYTPSNHTEVGKERKIEIKSVAGKYNLAYRRSYFEETHKELKAAEAASAKDPLRPLMDRGMPNFTEIRYRMKVAPAATQPAADAAHAGDNATLSGPLTRYTVNFSLATEGLNLFPGPDGVRRRTIEVAIVAYSQAGKPLNWETRSINLAIRPEQNAIAEASGIPFQIGRAHV